MTVRMRHTRGQTGNRRSHHALKMRKIVADKETGSLRLPHRLDEATGMYRGKQIAEPKVKKVPAKVSGKGTKHEHVHHDEKDEKKSASVKQAEMIDATASRPRTRSGTGS